MLLQARYYIVKLLSHAPEIFGDGEISLYAASNPAYGNIDVLGIFKLQT